MTVCNMAIEAGARAGLIGVDDKTIAYVKGRPLAPDGERLGAGRRVLAHACTPTPARISTRWSSSTRRSSCRKSPGARRPRWWFRSKAACPTPTSEKDASKRGAIERALTYMGARAGQADGRHPHRQGVHRLVHQHAHRRPARSRGGGAALGGKVAQQRQAGDGRAGLGPGQGSRPSAKGSTRCSRRPASNGASRAARCAWHERRPPRAGRALRFDQQPQLRRPPRRRRPHPPGQPGDGRGGGAANGHFVDVRRLGLKESFGCKPFVFHQGLVAPLDRDEHRHRRDHPEAVSEVDRALGLRPEPVRRMALPRPRRAGPGPATRKPNPDFVLNQPRYQGASILLARQQLRLRLEPRACAVGDRAVRLSRADRAELRRHLLQQLLQERTAADRAVRRAGGRSCSMRWRRFPATG